MKRGYSISGGGTKISALAGASIYTLRDYKYKPDYITGISAGGILAVPLALGLYDEIINLTQNFTYDDIFSVKPVNNKGKITFRGLLRILEGKQSLGREDNLVYTMMDIVTEELFTEYQNGNYPVCYLGVVEFQTGKKSYLNMKMENYETFLDTIEATSSMPVFVESVEFEGIEGYWYDGGVRDHIGSHWLMENEKIDEHISVYSRPQNYDITEKNWKPKNIYKVLQRTIDIMNVEISKNDELQEDILSKKKNIYNRKIFMPYILSEQAYEISPEKLKQWYEIGYNQAKITLSEPKKMA